MCLVSNSIRRLLNMKFALRSREDTQVSFKYPIGSSAEARKIDILPGAVINCPSVSLSNGWLFDCPQGCGEDCGLPLWLTGRRSPVAGEFSAQRPVTRSVGVFFDLRLNKRLSKQSWGWWFETLSHPLWRHCDAGEDCCRSHACALGC